MLTEEVWSRAAAAGAAGECLVHAGWVWWGDTGEREICYKATECSV